MSNNLSMDFLNQKADFWALLKDALPAMQVFNPKESAGGWWLALKGFSFDQAEKSVTRLLQLGKKAPVPSDAVAIIQEELELLWLSADEAWAAVLIAQDEDRSLFTTDAIMQASYPLRELIASDKIAGRMAFKSSYDRLKAQWKSSNRVPVVQFSAGHDKNQRIEMTKEALSSGLISNEQAQHFLPDPTATKEDLLRVTHQSASGGNEMAKEALKKIKSTLKIVDGSDESVKKWKPKPDKVFEKGGVMYVQYGDTITPLF